MLHAFADGAEPVGIPRGEYYYRRGISQILGLDQPFIVVAPVFFILFVEPVGKIGCGVLPIDDSHDKSPGIRQKPEFGLGLDGLASPREGTNMGGAPATSPSSSRKVRSRGPGRRVYPPPANSPDRPAAPLSIKGGISRRNCSRF